MNNMTFKRKIKITIDIAMTLALLLLMNYQFFGDTLHEWIGIGMFVLFVLHHIMNKSWHKNLFRGKYGATRIVMLCVDILILICMLMQMYSGIVISRHVFVFLDINSGMALARQLHVLGAYWGFILMSLHIGMHMGSMINHIKNTFYHAKFHNSVIWSFRSISFLISLYGVYAFIQRKIPEYLFLRTQFVFMDYSEPIFVFISDYIAILYLFACIGYYLLKLLTRRKRMGENT